MGQKIGRALFVENAYRFLNLRKHCIELLWESFNDVADGFGLSRDEFVEIVTVLENEMLIGRAELVDISNQLFDTLDTDENELVDALEFLTTMAMVSGLQMHEKVLFVFSAYDFDESDALTIDEMTLAFKSTVTGLCKLSGEEPPLEVEMERFSEEAFFKANVAKHAKIPKAKFVEFCQRCPEVRTWCMFYDDPEEKIISASAPLHNMVTIGTLDDESLPEIRTELQAAFSDVSNSAEILSDLHQKRRAASSDDFDFLSWVQKMVPPSDQEIPNRDIPTANLSLECRKQLRYSPDGPLLYPAGNLVVKYDIEEHRQDFYMGHTDDVRCLTIHPGGEFVATGSLGAIPEIIVWSARTFRTNVVIRGFHQSGITHLEFSPGGKLLLSIGMDSWHSIAVYEWETRRCVFSDRCDQRKILDCCFRDRGTFVTCGVDHIYFWGRDPSGKFRKRLGKFGKRGQVQPILCVGALNGDKTVVSGCYSGHLYLWVGRNCKSKIHGHEGPINTLYVYGTRVVTGGRDGKVRQWTIANEAIEPGLQFDTAPYSPVNSCIQSICINDKGRRFLIGTLGGEIFEMNVKEGTNMHKGPLVAGHCKSELWGIATHPDKHEYVTVGEDGMLRVWDLSSHYEIKRARLKGAARTCAYSPDGSLIAAGLGIGGHDAWEGMFVVFNEADLTVVYEAKDARKIINDIRFSPDGTLLAVASGDRNIYIYNIIEVEFFAKAKCKGHTAGVLHIDFSKDSKQLRSGSESLELCFWNADTGEQEKSGASMKDVEWETSTVPHSWHTRAAWPLITHDGTEIYGQSRSHNKEFFITTDNYGRLRLFPYPACDRGAPCKTYRGHSLGLRNAVWSCDDSYVLSCGHDCNIFQWRVSKSVSFPPPKVKEEDEWDSEDEDNLRDGVDVERTDKQSAALESDFTALFDHEDKFGNEEKFKAVKPWVGEIVPPTHTKDPDSSAPGDGLELEWVHGFRTSDIKQSLNYINTGEIVFTAGLLGIVMNRDKRQQRYSCEHTDDIISLAMHPDNNLVATGQIGRIPKISVWHSLTMETEVSISGFHLRGVSSLSFSNSGKLLASAGLEDDHNIAVWEWKNNKLFGWCFGSKSKVLDLSFTPDDTELVQVGVNHIKFHQLQGGNMVTHYAELKSDDAEGVSQTFHCIGWSRDRCIVGCADGNLYVFKGHVLKEVIEAHSKDVNCIYSVPGFGICTGGKDAIVKLWNLSLECEKQFDIGMFGKSVKASVRSVQWDATERKVLVGTRGSDIYEISATDGSDINDGPIIQGHSQYELWGLACNPERSEYVTVGDDATVRVWETRTKAMLRTTTLDCMMRCVCYHPDGKRLAIGFGGNVGKGKHKKSGSYVILNANTLEPVHEGKNSKQWLTAVRYSPDGNTLACASYDDQIYLYDVANGYMLRATFSKHNSFITHIDFSSDSAYLQSNCGAFELCYCDTSNGQHMPVSSVLRDVEWDTFTCTLGWPTQGFWPMAETLLGTDIKAICRSRDGRLICAADSYGLIKLARYPCLDKQCGMKIYCGHSVNVQNVDFTQMDTHIITVGGSDRCVFQWRLNADSIQDAAIEAGKSGDDSELIDYEEDERVEDFVAVKPWLGAIVPPSGAPPKSRAGPNIDLELDFVHGYRAQDSRSNLFYNSQGEIIYPTAALGVVYAKTHHRQRYFHEHTGDIISLTVDPTGQYVATGELGKRPSIYIWNASTCVQISKLSNFHRHGISCLDFSVDGKKLVSVGQDINHLIAVWSTHSGTWQDSKLQAYAMGGQAKVLFSSFISPVMRFQLMTGGVRHVQFWTLNNRRLLPTPGKFGSKGKLQPIMCGATVGKHAVTGTVSGHIYVWDMEGPTIVRAIKAHSKTINTMYSRNTIGAGTVLLTGSKDGIVKLWNHNLLCQKSFDSREGRPAPRVPAVRSVSIDAFGNSVLIGTQGSEVYEVSNIFATAQVTHSIMIVQGHFGADELWGLAPHPTDSDIYATTGDDAMLRIWSVSKKKLVRELALETIARAVAWSPDGLTIGIGLGGTTRRGRSKKDGAFLIIDAETLTVQYEGRDSREWITDCKFSPDGRIFAVGSRDSKIYLYDVKDSYILKAKCEKFSSYVTHIDFSANSAYIQGNSGAYELIFYNAGDGQQLLSASSVKDEVWASQTCVLGWSVQGLWPEVFDGNDITAAHLAVKRKMIACVDEFGNFKVVKNPALDKRADAAIGFGHSRHCSNVRWNENEEFVITTGGSDRTVMQWRVKDRKLVTQKPLELEGDSKRKKNKR